MRTLAIPFLLCVLACSSDETNAAAGGGSFSSTGSTVGGNDAAGGSGAGGIATGAGAASACLRDTCEAYADRETCCADPACGWHDGTGHQLFGVPPCVAKERVCEAGDRTIRDCPPGTTCLVQGASQETENDCTLAPPGQVYLPGRGICSCP